MINLDPNVVDALVFEYTVELLTFLVAILIMNSSICINYITYFIVMADVLHYIKSYSSI